MTTSKVRAKPRARRRRQDPLLLHAPGCFGRWDGRMDWNGIEWSEESDWMTCLDSLGLLRAWGRWHCRVEATRGIEIDWRFFARGAEGARD